MEKTAQSSPMALQAEIMVYPACKAVKRGKAGRPFVNPLKSHMYRIIIRIKRHRDIGLNPVPAVQNRFVFSVN